MAFESIPECPNSDSLLNRALASGRKKKVKTRKDDLPAVRQRKKERERITAISTQLTGSLRKISRDFPSIDHLSEFYRSLLSINFSMDEYRKQLGRIQKSAALVAKLAKQYRGSLEAAQTAAATKDAMKSYIGRTASVLKRLDSSFSYLEKMRLALRSYPTIKDRYTVCIAGFPNVGKTTLFCEVTGASAQIRNYAFTTKRLNVASKRVGNMTVQFIDTPGTLGRDKKNQIEQQAHLALKYCADIILYVYDPTEASYSMKDQKMLEKLMQGYKKQMLLYLAKTDLLTEDFSLKKPTVSKQEFLDIIKIKAH